MTSILIAVGVGCLLAAAFQKFPRIRPVMAFLIHLNLWCLAIAFALSKQYFQAFGAICFERLMTITWPDD